MSNAGRIETSAQFRGRCGVGVIVRITDAAAPREYTAAISGKLAGPLPSIRPSRNPLARRPPSIRLAIVARAQEPRRPSRLGSWPGSRLLPAMPRRPRMPPPSPRLQLRGHRRRHNHWVVSM